MQYRFAKIGLLCALVVSPCIAQAQTAVDAYRTEVAGLRKEVEALKEALKGAVVAFDRKKAQPCPDGWQPFEQAGGRFVVGAGFNKNASKGGSPLFHYPSIQDDVNIGKGGEERLSLTPAQLPPHTHSYSYAGDGAHVNGGASPAYFKFGGDAGMAGRGERQTGSIGSGTPIDILPPFVALYYCIKE